MRRVVVAFVAGLLLLISATVQAGAAVSDEAALAVTERGLALGLQAGAELAAQVEEGVVVGEGVAHSLEVLESIVERFNDERKGKGQGPLRAIEVHEALLNGALPSSIDREGPPGHAYGLLRNLLQGDGSGENRGRPPRVPPGQEKKAP